MAGGPKPVRLMNVEQLSNVSLNIYIYIFSNILVHLQENKGLKHGLVVIVIVGNYAVIALVRPT